MSGKTIDQELADVNKAYGEMVKCIVLYKGRVAGPDALEYVWDRRTSKKDKFAGPNLQRIWKAKALGSSQEILQKWFQATEPMAFS